MIRENGRLNTIAFLFFLLDGRGLHVFPLKLNKNVWLGKHIAKHLGKETSKIKINSLFKELWIFKMVE